MVDGWNALCAMRYAITRESLRCASHFAYSTVERLR